MKGLPLHHIPPTLLFAALISTVAYSQTGTFYVEPGSYGTQRETDPPSYVRNLGEAGRAGLDWLDFGLDYRLRYEYRDDDIRRPESTGLDDPFLLRTRAYVGIRNIADPLRLVFEFEDARRAGSKYAPDNRDVNKTEFIQGFAELYYPDALGKDARGNDRPFSIRAGRMAFEVLDRRLIARNEWRNTTNNFDGLRVSLGQDSNDWQLELLRLQPVTRLLSAVDRPDQDQHFTSVIGHWRGWSQAITLEPHYLRLEQDASAANGQRDRDIRATGLRVYGKVADGAVNYDISAMHQSGHDGALDHEAQGLTAEAGYTWLGHPWRPRLSLFYGYASGDRNPADAENNRFERFFGFARPWSSDDYVIFENLRAPKLKLEFQPIPGVRIDTGYSAFWLASDTDRFSNLLAGSAFNRDPSGSSGDFVGQGVDVRVRFSLNAYAGVNVGYAHFDLGEFTQNRQQAATGASAGDSDFMYLELTFSLF